MHRPKTRVSIPLVVVVVLLIALILIFWLGGWTCAFIAIAYMIGRWRALHGQVKD